MSEKKIEQAVREWSNTPSVNPRYKGATPAQLVRALLRKPVCHTDEKVSGDAPFVKTRI